MAWQSARANGYGAGDGMVEEGGGRYARPSVPVMPESPQRVHAARPLLASPARGAVRDWEGFMEMQRPRPAPPRNWRDVSEQASDFANATANISVSSVSRLVSPPAAQSPQFPGDPSFLRRPQAALAAQQHGPGTQQAYAEYKRAQYRQRMEAEARGEVYREQRPYSAEFLRTLPYAPGGGGGGGPGVGGGGSMVSLDFEGRARVLAPQVVGTKEEVAWLHPPPIPLPVGWNGYWDLCAGHELILQLMAVSGANPDNSPSLTEHFMYPELLSCFQRLQYGTYMVHYQRGEPPHERYFYVKSLPLANKAQYCPFFCWSTHRHAHQAKDCIPLCNVMWVTAGTDSPNFSKYVLGGDYINGPFVGKRKAELLTHGCMSIWFYDGRTTRAVDVLATDPLVFTMWMKLLEDVAQLNAALDITGAVRSLQKDIESSRESGELPERFGVTKKAKSILS